MPEYPFANLKTTFETVTGLDATGRVTDRLLAIYSQWFAVEPWPDNEYRVYVKIENADLLRRLVREVNGASKANQQ